MVWVIRMMDFHNYLRRNLKAWTFAVVGLIMLFGGSILLLLKMDLVYSVYILGGLCFIAYGWYIRSRVSYERENEGHRVYHYKGGFK